MARRRKGDKALAEGLELEGFVFAGTPEAFEALDPRAAESPHCVRCGSSISNVFLTSKGPMGGDCLATLTGDQSTRKLARKLIKALDVEMGYRQVTGLKVVPMLSHRGEYKVVAVSIDRSDYDSWSGRYGEKERYLTAFNSKQLPVMIAIAGHEAEVRGLNFDAAVSEAPMRNPDLERALLALRLKFARAAQGVYDAWDQDDEGMDAEYGVGGICHDIASAMVDVVYENLDGIEAYTQDSGGMGEQHVWMVAHDDEQAFIVDIPPGVYESGAGYQWTKLLNITIEPEDVIVEELDRELVDDTGEFYNNPEAPIVIVGIGPANRHLLGDQVLPAMEEFPELEGLMEQLYAGNFELYDMDQFPEKGDALDAVTTATPLVITHNIYGIDVQGDFKYSSGHMYNQRNELWLPVTRELGVPLLVIGEQPETGRFTNGLYNVPKRNPLPSMEAFLQAAQDVLGDDWSGRGFVGRDELVSAVLERMGYGECALAGDAAERALLAVAGRENPGCIVYDKGR